MSPLAIRHLPILARIPVQTQKNTVMAGMTARGFPEDMDATGALAALRWNAMPFARSEMRHLILNEASGLPPSLTLPGWCPQRPRGVYCQLVCTLTRGR